MSDIKCEPFGYFKAEPFGWTDCAETDEGAIALYEAPQQTQSVADALEEVISIIWDVLDNPELSGHGYCNDLEGRIRALIKRNAVKEGE